MDTVGSLILGLGVLIAGVIAVSWYVLRKTEPTVEEESADEATSGDLFKPQATRFSETLVPNTTDDSQSARYPYNTSATASGIPVVTKGFSTSVPSTRFSRKDDDNSFGSGLATGVVLDSLTDVEPVKYNHTHKVEAPTSFPSEPVTWQTPAYDKTPEPSPTPSYSSYDAGSSYKDSSSHDSSPSYSSSSNDSSSYSGSSSSYDSGSSYSGGSSDSGSSFSSSSSD